MEQSWLWQTFFKIRSYRHVEVLEEPLFYISSSYARDILDYYNQLVFRIFSWNGIKNIILKVSINIIYKNFFLLFAGRVYA